MTVTEPVTVKVQDNVDVPEPPVTIVGVNVHAELSDTRARSPVNPLKGEMVIVEVPAEFTATVTLVGLAEISKSGAGVTVKSTVAG